MLHKSILLLLYILLFTFCSDDKSTNPTDERHFYPLKVGNTWTYDVEDDTPYSQTIRIDRTVVVGNGKTAYHIDGDDDYTFGARNLYYEGTILFGFENDDPTH